MSLTKQYVEQEKERQEEAKKTHDFYETVNLPGDRTFDKDTEGVRKRIAEMAIEKAKPNHDEKK